jgi:hypothetical protein
LEAPGRPVGIYIGADRGAAGPDGLTQDASQGIVEAEKGFFWERIGPPVGVDLSLVESLIGVDVSHPGQESLV